MTMSPFKHFDSLEDLEADESKLMKEAISMLERAYAPYSGFRVGAAAMTEDGRIFRGCNQENASYPLCICGERVALFNAGSEAHDVPVIKLAIVCKNSKNPSKEPVSPCGACRQVIAEFESRHQTKIKIILKGDADKIYTVDGINELLPYMFDSSRL